MVDAQEHPEQYQSHLVPVGLAAPVVGPVAVDQDVDDPGGVDDVLCLCDVVGGDHDCSPRSSSMESEGLTAGS